MRKICVVTGSRADYGLLTGLLRLLEKNPLFQLQLIVSGMHLSPDFGLTYTEIEADGFVIDAKVDMNVSGSSAGSVLKSMGLGVSGFADAFETLQPDLVVILGDRFEALVAAQSAMMLTIPIAHIHGGEVTEGAVDESIRHAISKMSNIHFVATNEYRKRVIQLGELPSRVFLSGAPGIDNIHNASLVSRGDLEKRLDFQFRDVNFMVTYHPVTLGENDQESLKHLFEALDHFPDAKVIITYPNADADGREIIALLKRYSQVNHERVFLTPSLGYVNYLSALPHIDCVIGNSSSGLLEAPSFQIPTVNIGDRQKGRIKAGSVIDSDESVSGIVNAITLALSEHFKEKLQTVINPYGEGGAAERIAKTLEVTEFSSLIRKPFYDVDFEVNE